MKKTIDYWIEQWQKSKIFCVENDQIKTKKYHFSCFPKTSFCGFQNGDIRPVLIGDVYSRYHRMADQNVLYPVGFDSLGPEAHEELKKNKGQQLIDLYEEQMLALGIGIDDQKKIDLGQENYITSLQLSFIELYEKGYIGYDYLPVLYDKKNKKIKDFYYQNGSLEQLPMKCFYLNIASVLSDIISKIEELVIDQSIKKQLLEMLAPQKSITLSFPVTNGPKLTITLKEPEYMGGISFILIHPDYIDFSLYAVSSEYPAIEQYLSDDNTNDFGVFTGSYAINPLTGRKIPIFISVLYPCPVYVANPYRNEWDRTMALEECLPVIDVVQNGVFIESDFLNGVEESLGRSLLIENFSQADLGEVHEYYSKDKILLSSLDVYGVLFPFLLDEDGNLYSLKDKLPFSLTSKFRMVLASDSTIAVNKIEGSLNDTFSNGMLPILALLYDEIGDPVSLFSKEAIRRMNLWNGIELLVTKQEDLFETVFFPLCILAILEHEKKISLPPLCKDLILVGPTVDEQYQTIKRANNNLLNLQDYLNQGLGDALRIYFLSKPLNEAFSFKEEELQSLHHLLNDIEKLFYQPFSKEQTLPKEFKAWVEKGMELLERKAIVDYVHHILSFYKSTLWKTPLHPRQALLFLKLLYPIVPFMAEDIYHEVFKGKYLLSDAGWLD